VVFDHLAAAAAVEAVAAMRFVLELSWTAEVDAADDALARWEGLASDAFRASLGARRAATADLARTLVVLQRGIEDAVDDAVLEQRRIDALQAEWDAELARERLEAAEAAAGLPPRIEVS
jgi:hypothetical protein